MASVKSFIFARKYINYLQFTAYYRSIYCQDNLYKEKTISAENIIKQIKQDSKDKFNGFIPLEELQISHSRSSGPGGQHVNKVNTKVEIRFHVKSAKWLNEDIKEKLIELEANRINKDGFIILTSEKTRKQLLNQADCLHKLRSIIRTCEPREVKEQSQEQLLEIQQKKDAARASILRIKRLDSLTKQLRTPPSTKDIL